MRKARTVYVKDIPLGDDNPVVIQSMCISRLEDTPALIDEINRLENAGAQIVRFAVRNMNEARLIPDVVRSTKAALCADIHFDHRLALEAIMGGVHKIRLNPGNIGSENKVAEVVAAAKEHRVPIRIGVNSGSIDRTRFREITAEAMVESAMEHVRILEALDFHDIVISLKSSDTKLTVESNRLMAEHCEYPLHLGLTEAGFGLSAVVKSAVAIGSLLLDGIGSTIRVSLTGDPGEEIDAARRILAGAGCIDSGFNIISCPTCGRTDRNIDLRSIAETVEKALSEKFSKRLANKKRLVTVAIMGCEVNGPGEASDADIGIAGSGKGSFLFFSKGVKIRKIQENEIEKVLAAAIDEILLEES